MSTGDPKLDMLLAGGSMGGGGGGMDAFYAEQEKKEKQKAKMDAWVKGEGPGTFALTTSVRNEQCFRPAVPIRSVPPHLPTHPPTDASTHPTDNKPTCSPPKSRPTSFCASLKTT